MHQLANLSDLVVAWDKLLIPYLRDCLEQVAGHHAVLHVSKADWIVVCLNAGF